MLLCTGGTPDGFITACAIKATGRMIQGRLAAVDDEERQKAIDAGHDLDAILSTNDLVATENCYFAATGITDGDLLRGTRYFSNRVETQSIIMRGQTGTVRIIEAEHRPAKWKKSN